MSRTIWIVAALLACIGSAHAQLPRTIEPLEEGYEIDVKSVSFPGQLGGAISLTPCDTCKRVSHQTTEQTAVVVNGKPALYEDFLKVVDERRGAQKLTYVGVNYNIETKLVTRIEIRAL
jgi:hypothetical protein